MSIDLVNLLADITGAAVGSINAMFVGGMPDSLGNGALGIGAAAAGAAGVASSGVGSGSGNADGPTGDGNPAAADRTVPPIPPAVAARRYRSAHPTAADQAAEHLHNVVGRIRDWAESVYPHVPIIGGDDGRPQGTAPGASKA